MAGLGFQPQCVVFFGGNQSALDSLIVAGTPAIFYGMAWEGIDQQSTSLIAGAPGVSFLQSAIHCCSSSASTIDYRGNVTAFNADGFSVSFSVVAGGSRVVHWLAIGDFDMFQGHYESQGGVSSTTYGSLGEPALTTLGFNHWTAVGRNNNFSPDMYFGMGTSNWPEDPGPPEYHTAGTVATGLLSTGRGITNKWINWSADSFTDAWHGGPAGVVFEDLDHAYPTPSRTSDGIRFDWFGFPYQRMTCFWNGEGHCQFVESPAVGVTNTYNVPDYIASIEAALFFGIMDASGSDGLNPDVMLTLGVLTDDYQGSVALDTGLGDPPANGSFAFYQSQTKCYIENARAGVGPQASSGDINGDQIALTGTNSPLSPLGGAAIMQVYGDEPDLPQFFRRQG